MGNHKGCPYAPHSYALPPHHGQPQGLPLRSALLRPPSSPWATTRVAPTLRTPTPSLLTMGNHKGCPYAPHSYALPPHHGQPQGLPLRSALLRPPSSPWATTRVAPTLRTPTPSLLTMGNHKGCPYAPHSYALPPHHRATTRVAPRLRTPTPSLLTMGNHKGCPYAPHSYAISPHHRAITRVAPTLLTPLAFAALR